MSGNPKLEDTLRAAIIAKPDAVLDDKDVMNALVAANEQAMGSNIVDLRGIAMQRLETRLDRLENTHQNVISAAYDNLSGTQQVHRAILLLLESADFESFLRDLAGDVADSLRLDHIRLVLESADSDSNAVPPKVSEVLSVVGPGFIDSYLTRMRGGTPRQVTLRRVDHAPDSIYGAKAGQIMSEACLKLDLGPDRLPGLLVLGAESPDQFTSQQGTDLLAFFTGVFERTMRRWLA